MDYFFGTNDSLAFGVCACGGGEWLVVKAEQIETHYRVRLSSPAETISQLLIMSWAFVCGACASPASEELAEALFASLTPAERESSGIPFPGDESGVPSFAGVSRQDLN